MNGRVRMPLPNGVTPITFWKYWGMANNSPKRANETMVASTVPHVNRDERNSRRSIKGSPWCAGRRRSQRTNPHQRQAADDHWHDGAVLPQPL